MSRYTVSDALRDARENVSSLFGGRGNWTYNVWMDGYDAWWMAPYRDFQSAQSERRVSFAEEAARLYATHNRWDRDGLTDLTAIAGCYAAENPGMPLRAVLKAAIGRACE